MVTPAVPVYEVAMTGRCPSTPPPAVIDQPTGPLSRANNRKHHIPHCHPGFFWESLLSRRGKRRYHRIPDFVIARVRALYIATATATSREKGGPAHSFGLLNGANRLQPSAPGRRPLVNTFGSSQGQGPCVANAYFSSAPSTASQRASLEIERIVPGRAYFCDPRGKNS